MVSSFDTLEIRREWQRPPYDTGIGRVGNSLVLSAGPELHRHADIGESNGIKSKSQARRCNNRGGDASIIAPYG